MASNGLDAVYPKIGGTGTVTSATRMDFGVPPASAHTAPTATVTTATAVIAGLGHLKVSIDGSSYNIMTCLDA